MLFPKVFFAVIIYGLIQLKGSFIIAQMMLRRRKDVHAEEGNWIELQDYVGRFGIEDRSLQKIYANLFGLKISKNQRLSNWEADSLTEAQMRYAATDAWACVQIYNCLEEMERTGDYEVVKSDLWFMVLI